MYLEVFKKVIDSSLEVPSIKGLTLIAAYKFIYHPLFLWFTS